jgi:alkylated DNA repair protein (DNA oxidative demethylase)
MRGKIVRPAGLVYQKNFLSQTEEAELLKYIGSLDLKPFQYHDYTAKRSVKSFGLGLDFKTQRRYQGAPLPEQLLGLRDGVARATSVNPNQIIEALITEYPPGAAIGWHRDAPPFQVVIGLSLQAACELQFQYRLKEERLVYSVLVEPRSLYILRGEARSKWQHHIPPVKEHRYSITFRTI